MFKLRLQDKRGLGRSTKCVTGREFTVHVTKSRKISQNLYSMNNALGIVSYELICNLIQYSLQLTHLYITLAIASLYIVHVYLQ